jgi:hypothetical protein
MSKQRRRRQKLRKRGAASLAAIAGGTLISATRRDTLVRLIDTAIWMWFLEKDPFATHMLACAAYNCLCDLGNPVGKGPKFQQVVTRFEMTAAYDFMRHASPNQLNDSVDLPPAANEWILFYGIQSFGKLYDGFTAYMRTFAAYFAVFLTPPDSKSRKKADAFLPEGVVIADVEKLGKLEFFAELTEVFAAEILRQR